MRVTLLRIAVAALALVLVHGHSAAAASVSSAGQAPAQDARVDRCGTITGLFLEDLPSGGSIWIDGDRYLVGGVGSRGSFRLPPLEQVQLGAEACFRGIADEVEPKTFDIHDGQLTIPRRILPSTSTSRTPWAFLMVGLLLLASGVALLCRPRAMSRGGALVMEATT